MALDTAPQQNGTGNSSGAEADPADQTAIEEASVIHLLRVLIAEAAPPTKVSEDAMDHDSPSAAQAQDVNDVTCEEAGCLLWDMSASRPVARVMLRNRALEALEIVIARELEIVQRADEVETLLQPQVMATATPTAGEGSSSPEDRQTVQQRQPLQQQHPPSPPPPPQQQKHRTQNAPRILEICLGTLANLVVTQSSAAVAVSSRPELLALLLMPRSSEDDDPDGIAAQPGGGALYVDDARVLSELFRLFSLALRCQGSAVWLSALSSPAVLQRIMWVGAATADAQLFTRFLDMVVALLHAASGSASGTGDESGGGKEQPTAGAADPDNDVVALDGHGGAALPATGPACCRVLLECGLMGLLHQVLLQALRACMPAEEKYNELGGGDAEAFVSAGDSDHYTGASPPSIISEPAASAFAGNLAAAGRVSNASTVAAGVVTDITPRSNDSCRFCQLPDATTSVLDEGKEDALRGAAGSGSCGPGAASPSDAAAVAIWAGGAATAAAAAAATAAVATSGPVPLSDEAVDAALRLIEELVSPSGPLVLLGESPHSHGKSPPASGGSIGAEVLLQFHAERGLRPGLMQLLLGLLRYQYDSMQVIEGLLVVLVDLGNAVPDAVAALPPDAAAAVAARLVELLQDSSFSPAEAATPSTVQLQQGAWYLLAATLSGALAAVAAAAAPPAPALVGDAQPGAEQLGQGTQAQARTSSGVPTIAAWLFNWPSLERSLSALPELPRPDGCLSYTKACCVAGVRLQEELWDLQVSEIAVAPDDGSDGQSQEGGDGPQRSPTAAKADRRDMKAAVQKNGIALRGSSSNEESLVRLGRLLHGMLSSLDVPAS